MNCFGKIECEIKEMSIELSFELDGWGELSIVMGVGFFDYMLDLFLKYGFFDFLVNVKGDLYVD